MNSPGGGGPQVGVIDPGALIDLERDFGDREVVREIVELFMVQLRDRHPAVLEAAATGDLVGVQRAAHTLGSASAMVGAVQLLDLCQRLEACELTGSSLAAAPVLFAWALSCLDTAIALTGWLASP